MRVIVDDMVVNAIDNFYIVAMSRHISLSEGIVMAKKKRLISALKSLSDYYFIYPKARWKREWITNSWQDFICEDFHFAYEEVLDKNCQKIIFVCDAVHSLLYH
jgi:hypothetical protein